MLQTIFLVLTYVMLVLTVLTGVFQYRYLTLPFRFIFWLTVLSLFSEVIANVIIWRWHSPNLWVYNLQIILSLYFSLIAAVDLLKQKLISWLAGFGASVCTMVWVWQIKQNGMNQLVSYAFLSNCILLVTIYLVLLMKIIYEGKHSFLQPPIWLCMAILVYYGCNIPLFSFLNYFLKSQGDHATWNIYVINNVLSVTYYLMIITSFFLNRKQNLSLQTAGI